MTAKRIRIEFNVDTIKYESAVDDMISTMSDVVYDHNIYHPFDPLDPNTDYLNFTAEVIDEFPSPGKEARRREREERAKKEAHSKRWERAEGLYRSKMVMSHEQFIDFASNIAEEINMVTVSGKKLYMISDDSKNIMYGATEDSPIVRRYRNIGLIAEYNDVEQFVWKLYDD